MDITYRTEYAILEVRPTGALRAADFDSLAKVLQLIGSQLAAAGTKQFPYAEKDAAEKWLLS